MKQSKTTLIRRSIFYLLWAILMVLIYLRYVVQIGFPREILLLIYAVIVLNGNRDEILAMCMCSIPLYTSFQYTFGVAVCIIVYIIKYGKEIRLGRGMIPIWLLWIWELLHCFSGGFSIKENIVFLFPYILCLLLMYSNIENVNYSVVVRTFAICTVFMCLVTLSKLLIDSGYNIERAFINMQRLGLSDSDTGTVGAYFNPNTLGYFCVLASTGLIQLMVSGKHKMTDIIIVIVLVVCGILTTSRTYLACLLLMILLFLFSQKGKFSKKVKFVVAATLLAIVVVLIAIYLFPTAINNFILRFQVDDVSSGRMDLVKQYNQFIFSSTRNLFFGTGLYNFRAKIDVILGVVDVQVPHNGFQEILVIWGIPGFIIFMAFLYCLVKRSRCVFPKQKLINYIPLILLLVKVQAGQMVTAFYTMMMFSMAYLSLCYDFDGKESIKNDKA